MSATADQKRTAIEVLSGMRALPVEKYAWGRRMRLSPGDTDYVWREALRQSPHHRASTPAAP